MTNPLISIVMPVYNTKKEFLDEAIKSCINQTYTQWELCICDDGSTKKYIKPLLNTWAAKDKRIKLIFSEENNHISSASNKALSLAKGKYIALVDHDDVLNKNALLENVKVIRENPDIDFIYSDEDKIDKKNKLCKPFFKPDWSPEFLLSCNYICHLSVIRKRLIGEVGGFQSGLDGAQDHDLFLKITEKTKQIHHIPKILYHWRISKKSIAYSVNAKRYVFKAARETIGNALKRRKIKGQITNKKLTPTYQINYKIIGRPLVSIIIPFKDKYDLTKQCIENIKEKTNYKNYELILVNNNSKDENLLGYLEELQKEKNIRIINFNGQFNYSKINNSAVEHAAGEYLLFLNNDIKIEDSNWIETMLGNAQQKEIGAVGMKLLLENNRIQHLGVIIGEKITPLHILRNFPESFYSEVEFPMATRNFSAVTAACMMVPKKTFLEVGGFDKKLKIEFNDIDLCLKIRKKGYRIVSIPFTKIYHFEMQTRKSINQGSIPEDGIYFLKKWRGQLQDPYHNINLGQSGGNLYISRRSKYYGRYPKGYSGPNIVMRTVMCFKEHGFVYTYKMAGIHLKALTTSNIKK